MSTNCVLAHNFNDLLIISASLYIVENIFIYEVSSLYLLTSFLICTYFLLCEGLIFLMDLKYQPLYFYMYSLSS